MGIVRVAPPGGRLPIAIALCPDGRSFAIGTEDGRLRVLDLDELDRVWTGPAADLRAEAERDTGLAVEDGQGVPLPWERLPGLGDAGDRR